MPKQQLPSIKRVKQRAKILKRDLLISHKEALKKISLEYGFDTWESFKHELDNLEQIKIPTPLPTNKFVEDLEVEMNEYDYEVLDKERENDLPESTKTIVLNNRRTLIKLGVEHSIFEPTNTGLNKSIIDATQPVRSHFLIANFHNYSLQKQGPDYKILVDSILLSDEIRTKSVASLYRPKTKNGDPRMWFKKLASFAEAGDQIAIIIYEYKPYLLNLNKIDLEQSLKRKQSLVKDFLTNFLAQRSSTASELLSKLRNIAKTPFPALRKGDTAIGYSLETLLGIEANSSKKPDFKGIEIKSGRSVKTRTTLFAQVADWGLSPCKKSAEILNKYGYERDDDFKLYCTVSSQRENSQGLSFIYDQDKDELQEWHNKTELVAIWPGNLLRSRLKEKHAETFWIEARSEFIKGVEHFQLLKVIHTKSPLITQLMPLIQAGVISMDHLIKRNGKTNRVSEKGPLFKINKRDLDLLFPEPEVYYLNDNGGSDA